jgi:hypothetical protein
MTLMFLSKNLSENKNFHISSLPILRYWARFWSR